MLLYTQSLVAERPSQAGLGAGDVTIVAHDIGPAGGMERQLTDLIVGLRELGHAVTVIARTCELPAGTDVEFHRVRGPSRPFVLAYPWFLLAGSLAVWRWRRGIVQATGAIVFDRVDAIAIHYCHQVGISTASRQTPLFRAHIKLVAILKRLGERLCFARNRKARYVCVSEGVADEMRTYFPALAERTLAIHNGVDTAQFAPGRHAQRALELRRALGVGEGRLVLAFVGGEWERKGLRAVIESLSRAPEWDLLVVGEGEQPRYRELARSLDVGNSVHWLGVTREVEVVYALADAFVLPSDYETFSLVTFEAAASGLPILATPVNGVRELIVDGESGFLIAPSADAIAERLSRLAADPALRARLAAAARSSALAFGTQRMVTRHHELYARLNAVKPD
jgi:UDP-glucose:(heptosyl)LPS alpha-1,3-glucosyltransferase